MVCQNDESLALMITSTFLPAAAPPAPPPVLDDVPPAARPATTPSTTAIRTITDTSDNENLILTFEVILSPPEKTFTATSARVQRCREMSRENVYSLSGMVPPHASTDAEKRRCSGRRNVFPPPHHEGGRGRRGRQPCDGVAGGQQRALREPGARREGAGRGRVARLPPQRRRELAAPRHVGEHRPDLRRRRESVLRRDPRRRRGGRARARGADLRRQLRRGAGARARAGRGVRRARSRRPADRPRRRRRSRLPAARCRDWRRPGVRRPPAALPRRGCRLERQRG